MHIDTSTAQAQWFARYSAARNAAPAPRASGVLYSEASYFDGYAFAHIAAWDEHNRLSRARKHFVRNVRSNRR